MREQGEVISVKKARATVKVDKKDECSKCGMCLFPKGASSVEFDAENKLNAKQGDTVIIETQKDGKLLGVALAFLVPLLLVGVAIALNYLVIFNELITLGVAVGLVVVWYAVLALIDKKLKKTVNFSTKIVEIINEKNIEDIEKQKEKQQ